MPKYIEFFAKFIGKKSNRKTRRKRGGGFTDGECNATPLTGEVTVPSLESKIRNPRRLNVKLVSKAFMRGSFNIATEVCSIAKESHIEEYIEDDTKGKRKRSKEQNSKISKQKTEGLICRFWTQLFYIDTNGSIINLKYPHETTESLDLFAKEMTTTMYHSNEGNALPIYDIQAVPINGPLLSFLTREQKQEYFGINTHPLHAKQMDQCLCLCVVMKKGDSYEITAENFNKTMDLFERIAESDICIDLKPENLLCSDGDVVMIDWDPNFIKKPDEMEFRTIEKKNRHLFGSSMMKYLFCMFLIINNDDEIDTFKNDINEVLDEIMKLQFTDNSDETFLFIVSSFYNQDPYYKFVLHGIFKTKFKGTINSYQWRKINPYQWRKINPKDFDVYLFMDVQKYIVNCDKKALCERLCILSDPNYIIKYDESTQSILYYKRNQCPNTFVHTALLLLPSHQCVTQLTDVKFEMNLDLDDEIEITFSYRIGESMESKSYTHPY